MAGMPGRGVLGIVAVGTLARMALALSVGPGNDEAYYALYLEHPDWSYFDHPPNVAVVAAFGRAITGGMREIAALRLGFNALFAASTLLMARIASRAYGPSAAMPAALALNASFYFGAAVGTFVLPDGPLLFFWLLAMERLLTAIHAEGRALGVWAVVGLAWGGALLSKYHAVFLPVAFLAFLLLDRPSRRLLRTPGPYLASAIGLALFAPVIAWNAGHGWRSFAFQGGRAAGSIASMPGAMLGTLAAQAGYLLPWMAALLAITLFRIVRRPGAVDGGPPDPSRVRSDRVFLAFAAVPLGFFAAVSLVTPVLPHWGLIGAVALMPPLGASWALALRTRPRRTRRRLALIAAAPIVATALVVAQARHGWLGRILLVPSTADPTRDLVGWDQIAEAIHATGLLETPGTFVFSGHWHVSGQLAWALGPDVPGLCYREGDARGFADWSQPDDWVGRDGLLVAVDDRSTEPDCFDPWFDRIEPLARFQITRHGRPLRSVRLFRCRNQTQPFPFGAPPDD